jgi:hypothetical protein
MTDTNYVSPMDMLNSGEDVTEIVAESKDYVPYELLEPTHGEVKYISQTREVKVSNRVSKTGVPFLSIELNVPELVSASGDKITLGRPLRTWVNSLQFKQRNRPGTTSSLSDYLQEAGFNVKELNGSAILEALGESASIPMEVVVSWTNRTKKLDDGTYEDEVLKTRDFNVSDDKDNPVYVSEIVKDGVTYKAKHRVAAFRRV